MAMEMGESAARSAESATRSAESAARYADERTRSRTGMGLMHWLTLGSIGASIALFAAGKKNLAIFVGLWPPTFQAFRQRSMQ